MTTSSPRSPAAASAPPARKPVARSIESFFQKKGAKSNATVPATASSAAGGTASCIAKSSTADTQQVKRRRLVVSDDDDDEYDDDDDEGGNMNLAVPVAASNPAEPDTSTEAVDADAMDECDEEGGGESAQEFTATWKAGDRVPFAALCSTFEAIEGTTKRLIITDLLTKFFVAVMRTTPDDLLPIIYLCVNRIGPTWESAELGIGETVLMKAIAATTGRTLQKIKADMQEMGDLGIIAQMSRSNQPTMFQPKPLTVRSVFQGLKDIAAITGQSSMQKKVDKIKLLLVACRNNESRYLIRALEGKLRIGLAEQSVLTSLAHASVHFRLTGKPKRETLDAKLVEAVATLKQVYSEVPTYEPILKVLLHAEIDQLPLLCKLTPGIPLKPMLAHPTKSITDVLNRFENIPFTCEYKYDGERAQVHRFDDGRTVIFSRNQENMSAKYPDIVKHMQMVPKPDVKSFVIDSEAVAWDRTKKQILPFQVLSTRKRKDVEASDITVQVCLFAFDLLYLNGESLIRKSLAERRELLYKSFTEVEGEFAFAKHMEGTTVDDIQTFLDESVAGNCEGLMVKTMNEESSYEPSKRSRNWLKVKKDYLAGVGDSLDLVVIGGYHGKGKRTGVLGGFLIACYDQDREEYQAISKIATGFSEEDLAKHTEFFKEHQIDQPKPYYAAGEGIKPDVWFDAVQVWEVKAADLSISPIYSAAVGQVDNNKGISLRFPRFIRIRDDKKPDEATTSDQVADMYRAQKLNTASSLDDDAY